MMEIENVVGKHKKASPSHNKETMQGDQETEEATCVPHVTLDMLKDLTLLEAVVLETLRLFPPVYSDEKSAATDDVLPDGTRVPKGTTISFEI